MDENKIFIGIDPGANGGIVVLDSNGYIVDITKMPPTPRDIYDFIFKYKDNSKACLEDVGHGIPGQSSSATAKFARHNGHLEMALIACGIPTVTARPQKWEKVYELGKSSSYSKNEWKNRLKAKAQQLFPQVKVTLWNADALLIAEYLRRKEVGK